ncbi:hypothetical protein FBY30_2740 [Arthrobacter sp. SLBN-83]|uniref:CHAP domain-containing protein n=1 Tax=Arthrobacter sp. SLBN-83 TaxID=2768449 RepID=UPI001151591E|nr:CHAP domain-containing protein [Arthrobacter sp. SLBN-83]TQJ60472.1 hypothetical protein FBY30_2740 [Arthrobacter sp. SLBN-83]
MSIIDDWFSFALGEALDPDGHYGNQCVDAVDHYAEFIFGVPWPQCVGAVNGARQLLDAASDEYWIRIDYYHGFIPQRGDVLVFGGDQYNQWGHTAPTESATNTYIDVLQQDGFGAPLKFVDGGWYSDKPAHRARLAYSQNGTGALKGVLRPRPEKLKPSTGLSYQGAITNQSAPQAQEEDDMPSAAEIAKEIMNYKLDRQGPGQSGQTSLAAALQWADANNASVVRATADTVLNTPIRRQGKGAGLGDNTSLGAMVAWHDSGTLDVIAAVAASAASDGGTVEQIKAAVTAALSEGTVKVDVTVQGAQTNG